MPDKARRPSILIADDDVDMREWLRDALEGAGYRVLEAANGKEAIRLLKAATVDLFITDLFMPEQEGIETIRILRRERPALQVIAISGAFGESFLRMARILGAAAVLQKPIPLDQLLQKVQELLREEGAADSG